MTFHSNALNKGVVINFLFSFPPPNKAFSIYVGKDLCTVSLLTLNIPSGVPPGPQTVIFCDPVVTITTDVLLIFVCVRHQLKINIM
jgi:hypothetical protein